MEMSAVKISHANRKAAASSATEYFYLKDTFNKIVGLTKIEFSLH